MKVCLFSSYSTSLIVDDYIVYYLEELTRFHDEVIFITNERNLNTSKINKIGVKIMFVENDGYDFGMWSKAMLTINKKRIDRLTLVNDSCILIKPLDEFFKWEKNNGFDYSGITNSLDISYHIQSYFLVIKKRAVRAVFDFFDNQEYFQKGIDSIIKDYEIGLSKHLILEKFKIGAMFHFEKYCTALKSNISIYFAKELIDDGCPLIKKKVAINSFRRDELFVLKGCGYDFGFDYKKYIQQEFGISKSVIAKLFKIAKVKDGLSSIAIWQIYYDERGEKYLDKDFLPYDNNGKTTSIFENEVIIDVWKKHRKIWKEADYIGVVSWRFADKTGLSGHDIQLFIDRQLDKKEVYSLLPPSTKDYPSPFLETSGHIYQICKIIDEHSLFPFKLSGFNSYGKCKVFCNYFLCKPSIFNDYVKNYLNKLLIWFESCEDENLKYYLRLMINHRGVLHPIHPFIMEGLFECYVNYKGYSYGYIEKKLSPSENVNKLFNEHIGKIISVRNNKK